MKKATLLPLFCSIILVAANVRAQTPPAPFGARGSIVFDRLLQYDSATGTPGMLGFSLQHADETGSAGSSVDRRNVSFAPAADWFPIRNVSLGLSASISHWRTEVEQQSVASSTRTSAGTTASIRPRLGYVLPLSPELSLWPRASVGYQRVLDAELAPGYSSTPLGILGTGWSASMGLPLIVTPSRNLFFAIGPELRFSSLSADNLVGPDGAPRTATTKSVDLAMVGGLGLVFGR